MNLVVGNHNSDDRIKHNQVDITNGLDIIMQLKPQIYNKTNEILDDDFNGNLDDLGILYFKEVGFIAQEVYEIDELKHIVQPGDEKTKWTMEYNTIIPYNTVNNKRIKSRKR